MSEIVFIHGSGFTGTAFAQQLATFRDAHAPDLPGHTVPGSCTSVSQFADFIEVYVRERGLREVVLCGNSLGGAIALECALRNLPELAGIILLGSGSRLRVAPEFLRALAEDFETAAHTIGGYLYGEPTPERIAAAVASMRAVGQRQTLLDYQACDAFDRTDRLADIRLPVLAITGELDRMTPPKYALALADRVPGAEARIVPGAGHLVMLERPAESNELMESFVHAIAGRA